MNIPGRHFFCQTFGGQGFDPQDASACEVMPVPKGHGYVFAVEAKHCRGVRAAQGTPTWRDLGIARKAMWIWSIFLGNVSKEYLGYERGTARKNEIENWADGTDMLAELLKGIISWLWFANGWSKWVIPNLPSFLMQRPWEILVSGAHQCSAASLSRKAPDRWKGKKCLVMAFADARSENRRMNDDKRMIQFVYPRLSKHLKKCPQKIASMHIQGVLKIIGVWLFGRRVFENGAFEHGFLGESHCLMLPDLLAVQSGLLVETLTESDELLHCSGWISSRHHINLNQLSRVQEFGDSTSNKSEVTVYLLVVDQL